MTCKLTAHRLRDFMRMVEKPAGIDGCWLWRGATSHTGHGVYQGHGAYRIAYEWMVGTVSDGMVIDHLCRVPACVNPHHLEPVTQATNMKRAAIARAVEFQGNTVIFTPVEYCRRGHVQNAETRHEYRAPDGELFRICKVCKRMTDAANYERAKARRSA